MWKVYILFKIDLQCLYLKRDNVTCSLGDSYCVNCLEWIKYSMALKYFRIPDWSFSVLSHLLICKFNHSIIVIGDFSSMAEGFHVLITRNLKTRQILTMVL